MNIRTIAISAAVFALAACNNGSPAQSTAASAVAQAAASMAAEASAVVAVNTAANDYLNLPAGFADKKGDAAFMPEGVADADVLLLQYDEGQNITVSVVKSAAFAGDAAALADKLKTALNQDNRLENVSVTADGQQVSYGYHLAGSEPKAAESCIVRPDADKNLLTYCAAGTDTDAAQLNALLSGSLK